MDSFKKYFISLFELHHIDYQYDEQTFICFFVPQKNTYIRFFPLLKTTKSEENILLQNEKLTLKYINIWEDQWANAQLIVISRIKSVLGLNFKLPARVFKIKRINAIISSEFLSQNHLQGNVNSKLKYGLFLPSGYYRLLTNFTNELPEKELLMGVMTFSNGKKFYTETDSIMSYELIRFATKIEYNIMGAFTKLLKNFIQEKQPGNIMTYVDADWSDGANLVELGFKYVNQTSPIYFKLNENRQRIKSAKTEGYEIVNTGSLKFIFDNFETN